MSRITLTDPANATGKPAELLSAVKAKLGIVPNMTRGMAANPAVLESYLAFSSALGHGRLGAKIREQIAIVVAEINECHYCLSAHTAIGKSLGLSPTELAASRSGHSENARAAAALRFAERVVRTGGGVSDDDLRIVRDAGFDDGEIAEIVATVALNVFTNLFNRTFDIEVDFPVVRPGVGV